MSSPEKESRPSFGQLKLNTSKTSILSTISLQVKLDETDETFEFVNDNGCFHLFDKSKRESFVKEVTRVMKPKAKYLMKCFSDKEPPNPMLPNRLSEQEIKEAFSDKFNILHIKPIIIEGKIHGDHKGWSCLMEKR